MQKKWVKNGNGELIISLSREFWFDSISVPTSLKRNCCRVYKAKEKHLREEHLL